MRRIVSSGIFFSFFILSLASLGFSQENITITTYYPSPNGVYGTLVTDRLGVGNNNDDGEINSADAPTTSGDVWVKGKVGIGLTDLSETLTVNGTLAIANNPGSYWKIDREDTTGALMFIDSTKGEYMRLTEWPAGNGFLGIGTTNPQVKLHVASGATSGPYFQTDYSISNWAFSVGTGQLGQTWFYITADGRIGLGTTSPLAEQHIKSRGWSGTGNADLLLETQNGNQRWEISAEQNSRRFSIYDHTSGTSPVLIDAGAPVDSIHILSDGKVGIGTATPLTRLQVQGDSTVFGNLGVDLQSILNGQVTANAGVNVMGNLGVNLKSVLNGDVYANANAYKPGGGPWTATSDRRLKKNIRPLKNALEKMIELKGVEFEWNEPKLAKILPGTQIGLIAQDVENILPQWVGTDDKGYKTLTPRGFEGLTVEAIKELQAEIEALKKQIKILESKIASGKGK